MKCNFVRSRYATPSGAMFTALKGAKNRYYRQLFWQLPAEKQEKVRKAAERYYTACDTEGVEPDSAFFPEVIVDMQTGKFQL